MNGQGPQLVAATEGVHEHEPQPGTIYTSGGLPVRGKLDQHSSYPIDAVCLACREPIRRDTYLPVGPGGDWRLKYPDGQ